MDLIQDKGKMRVAFVGAGNVATHLSRAMRTAGYKIVGVHTRSLQSCKDFAEENNCMFAQRLSDLPEADLYVFSIKDDALPCVISQFGELHRKGLCIHTAGSVPMSVFSGCVEHYGVIYPLQTFSKNRCLDFSEVPLFVEGRSEAELQTIFTIAGTIAKQVLPLSSDLRKHLHLAAVFACNFSNHCFAIASELLTKADLPAKLLNPLIAETCSKLEELSAVEGQTGPAVRYDEKVMAGQLNLLGDDTLRKDIYKLMSQSIHEYALKNKK